MTPPPLQTALALLAEYAATKAALDAATAPHLAEIARINAAITTATADTLARLEQLENQAKQLALDHGPEIFGPDKKSLSAAGYTLAVRDTAAVKVDDEESAIRRLQKIAQDPYAQTETILACKACLRITLELHRPYILQHFDTAPDWFTDFGIFVVEKGSASLKPAPKPRQAKPKTKAKPKPGDTPEA